MKHLEKPLRHVDGTYLKNTDLVLLVHTIDMEIEAVI